MNYGVIISYMVSREGLAIFHISSISSTSITSITASGILALFMANAPSQPEHHGAPGALHLHLLHHGAPLPLPLRQDCVSPPLAVATGVRRRGAWSADWRRCSEPEPS